MKEEGVTIDDLARMIKEEFDRSDTRFINFESLVRQEFDRSDTRFNNLDKRFTTLESFVKQGFDSLEHRMTTIEGKVDKLDSRMDRLEHDLFIDHMKRIERLEAKVLSI